MSKTQKNRLNNKGFSLLETVIAITIVSVIAVSAISVCLSGYKTTVKTQQVFFATNQCSNALEVFKSTANRSNKTDFLNDYYENLTQITEYEFSTTTGNNVTNIIYTLDETWDVDGEDCYTLNIKILQTAIGSNTIFSFSFVVAEKSGKLIYRMTDSYEVTL